MGGGIAGLASAIALGRQGWQCTVLERDCERRRSGQGLLLPPSGETTLQRLGLDPLRGWSSPIHSFQLCRPDGTVREQFAIRGALSLLHRELLLGLQQALPRNCQLVAGRSLELTIDTNGSWSVISDDQRHWRADLIVAADGVRSLCRRQLFPTATLTPAHTTELVLLTHAPELVRDLQGQCRKFESRSAGLALGLLPCRQGQLVVFAQFASDRHEPSAGPEAATMLRRCFNGWNAPLDALLATVKTGNAHLWRTTDLDPLPQLHHNNLVLVGDSGHPLLPVTSQGAASALEDALLLGELLATVSAGDRPAIRTALEHYSRIRLPVVTQLVAEGRRKQRLFLDAGASGPRTGAPLVGFGLETMQTA